MALIVNSQILQLNPPKDSEMYRFAKEYQDGLKDLHVKFPTGTIQLIRNGYPQMNKSNDPAMPSLPEIPPPIYFKLTRTDSNGVTWGYCKGRPKLEANGLASVTETENWEVLNGEIISVNLRNQPDYAFFLLYKSGILNSQYKIHDPEGDKLKQLMAKNAKLKVQYSIRDMEEDKLRMICQAWGVQGAGKKAVLILQEELEEKVFYMEDQKKKNPTDLMLKGVNEFLAEIKNDDVTRPKAIIQYAIDEKRLVFKTKDSKYYFDGEEICHVPYGRTDRQEYLAGELRNAKNSDTWIFILKALLDAEYINGLDKYGCRWLAGQLGLPLNVKEDQLRENLLAEFTSV